MEKKKSLFKTIVLAGLLAGTLDITAAFIQYVVVTEKNPVTVLRYISSAIWGKDAFTGGVPIVIAGLVFHYIIAFIFTVFFFLIYPVFNKIIGNKILQAIVYGIFVWCIMNLGVVPLTKAPAGEIVLSKAIISASILIVCIGLPLTFMAKKYYTK